MRQEMESQKLQLSSYCVKQVESLIHQGIVRMQTMNVDKNPGHTINAEQNLKSLIAYLSNYSKRAGTFPALSESDYDSAMRNPPPAWPFCSAGG